MILRILLIGCRLIAKVISEYKEIHHDNRKQNSKIILLRHFELS